MDIIKNAKQKGGISREEASDEQQQGKNEEMIGRPINNQSKSKALQRKLQKKMPIDNAI